MKRTLNASLLLCLSLAFTGCDDDEETPPTTNPPAVPTLGAMIDRQGRPAINTALNNTFAADATAAGTAKDNYNKAARDTWPTFSGEIAKNLAILDSLDANCGNQLLAGASATAGRYNTLAGVLADDQLYVNTASTTCNQYLAVEANAVNVVPNNDCGGRRLGYDVIQTSYSVLAAGALTGVDDAVSADADGNIHSADFPFLGAPR
jgi:hypothetical protein